MIGIIIGTNRKEAVSKQVAAYYEKLLAKKQQSTLLIDLKDMPDNMITSGLYDQAGKSEQFQKRLQEKVDQCQKFIVVVPEYNGSFPGVLKVFIDGLKFPDSVKSKKCALVGVSDGVQGGVLAMSHLTDIFNYLGMHVLALKPKLSRISQHFDGRNFSNPLYAQLIEDQVDGLITY